MSVQRWIDKNIPETYREGNRVNNGQRGKLESYCNEARIRNAGDLLGEMDIAVEWTVDFTVKNYMSNNPPKGTTDSHAVNPGNIKYIFEADIVGPFMGYYLAHDYNLYAKGRYSFRPISQQL